MCVRTKRVQTYVRCPTCVSVDGFTSPNPITAVQRSTEFEWLCIKVELEREAHQDAPIFRFVQPVNDN
jgi:glycerol dehydrogenase-like iron-containing ADH family enzyme